jgi:ABC-2 type transport system permease protein
VTAVSAESAGDALSPARPWLAAATLCRRELVRFLRQRHRIVGALGQPVLFWLLFAAGLGPSFRLAPVAGGDVDYGEYFFPGTMGLILLFTAIFATISIIEDRREGFLQSVLVAPSARWSLAAGKLAGGALLAVLQAAVFLVFRFWMPGDVTVWMCLQFAALALVLAFGLTGLGFVIAWRMDSTQAFHAVMSLFLLPMWLLSGAFFPIESKVLAWVAWANPMTYGVAGLRQVLFDVRHATAGGVLPSLAVCWAVTSAFAGAMFVAAWWVAGRRTTGDLL